MILVYFPSGECLDDRTNHHSRTFQRKSVLDYQKNGFNVHFCLNLSWRYEHNQFERRDEKPRHQRQLFQNLDNFYI